MYLRAKAVKIVQKKLTANVRKWQFGVYGINRKARVRGSEENG